MSATLFPAPQPIAPPPLSLYVHIPWCESKCPYCDFNSHTMGGALPEDDYVAALLADLEEQLPRVAGRSLCSVFIGGGTPSLFSAHAIGALLEGIARCLPFAPELEITLEANPASAEQRRFADFRAAGVNRLSLGIQSLDDTALAALGRRHDAAQARAAVAAASAAGFQRLNLDLMHGLPGQSASAALDSLREALAMATEHLSWYQLTLEPGTPFHRRPPPLPGDDEIAAVQERGEALLVAAGLLRYEISAFARPGGEARHNLNYWHFGDYLGIGAGAHGKHSDSGFVRRSERPPRPADYLRRQAGREWVPPAAELPLEYLMNALRLSGGVPAAQFAERTGLPVACIASSLAQARDDGLLDPDPQRLAPTAFGQSHLNELLSRFLPLE